MRALVSPSVPQKQTQRRLDMTSDPAPRSARRDRSLPRFLLPVGLTEQASPRGRAAVSPRRACPWEDCKRDEAGDACEDRRCDECEGIPAAAWGPAWTPVPAAIVDKI